ncbi:alpha/beta fold hydrolase [Nocardiopsis sp. NPDC058789]|uniref:Alpha/beta hydrolase n=1 Tax=Nocardiopsis eucommiae TaxID=2831970 RepID=A0A975QK20_9ACTN|nr:alpha/beta hydrolase [Nocardiopsis eucommiae]
MRLATHTSGAGDRRAVLVHGGTSLHRTWHGVEAELLRRGYQVTGVDLRGHGASPRGTYTVEALRQDLVDTLRPGAELVMGHSIGCLALSLALDHLRPGRAVHVDPAFRIPPQPEGASERLSVAVATADADRVRELHPGWSDEDVRIELAGFAATDPDFHTWVIDHVAGEDHFPKTAEVPSLAVIAGVGSPIGVEGARVLAERGFTVRTVEGAGHHVHRDDLPGLLAALDGWI